MLGLYHPMSSPQMTRMLGFFSWASMSLGKIRILATKSVIGIRTSFGFIDAGCYSSGGTADTVLVAGPRHSFDFFKSSQRILLSQHAVVDTTRVKCGTALKRKLVEVREE